MRKPRVDCNRGRYARRLLALACASPGHPCNDIALAGDYVWHDYPATLEAAVRSGLTAARWLLAR